MKTLPYINILAASRTRLGLTQEQLAMQLGISKSMVKMVETNRRSLSTEKLAQVAMMEQQLDILRLNSIELPASLKTIQENNEKDFELQIQYLGQRCSNRAAKLKKQLKRMEREHHALQSGIYSMEALQAFSQQTVPGQPAGIALNKPGLIRKILKCNSHAQEMMQKKIAVLHAEATLYQSIDPVYVHKNEKPILSPLKQTNMEYTLSLITSREDCQAMIDMANDDKESLVYRKTGLLRQKQTANTTSVSIEADLAAVTAELSALQTVFDGLPEGEVKEDTRVRIKKAEYKKFLLEQRRANYGSIALIGKEYDIACIEQSITETETFITALTTRLGELPQP